MANEMLGPAPAPKPATSWESAAGIEHGQIVEFWPAEPDTDTVITGVDLDGEPTFDTVIVPRESESPSTQEGVK